MIDEAKLRDKLQDYIDHAGAIVTVCGVAGGHIEAARAEVARELLTMLDAQPELTSTERIQLAEVTADRDALLLAISRITVAVGLPEGFELDKVIQRIEELA